MGGWYFKSKADPTPLGSQTLFTYTGDIEFEIYGVITTTISAGTTNVKLNVTPDALSAYDICANKDIDAFLAGTVITTTGTASNAAVASTGVGTLSPFQASRHIATCITSGIISVTMGAATAGAISWKIRWRPLTPSATVV